MHENELCLNVYTTSFHAGNENDKIHGNVFGVDFSKGISANEKMEKLEHVIPCNFQFPYNIYYS